MNPQVIKDYKFILFMVALMWLLEIANQVLGHRLNEFALIPRHVEKLFGIITMHFLHWNLIHIISNTIPLLILGFFICTMGRTLKVSFTIMLLSGLLVWLFARNGIHAGASGLVMGYWGYLLSSAFFDRSIKNILVAVLTIAFYGGMVFSLVDFRASISFEGHLFGLLSGIFSAWLWRNKLS